MDNFKLASRQKLKFQTNKGPLTTEQLWDLELADLDALAGSLEIEHEKSEKKSFLNKKTSAKDKTAKLKFDIVIDIIGTLETEEQAATEAKDKRKIKADVLAEIQERKGNLKNKSDAELEEILRSVE